MGCVFLPRYKGKDGTLRVSSLWWMKYRNAAGIVVREASGTDKKRAAERLLAKRTGAAADGRPTSPHTEKVTVHELLADLENEYLANDRGVARLRYSLAHVRPVFGARRAGQVTTADVTAYIVERKQASAANATINRELAALKRAYSLATKATPPKLYLRPYIPMLTENNVRSGFFERHQLDAVLSHLPEALRPLMIVASIRARPRTRTAGSSTSRQCSGRPWRRSGRPPSGCSGRRAPSSRGCSIVTASPSRTCTRRGGGPARRPAVPHASRTTSGGPPSGTSSARACRARWR